MKPKLYFSATAGMRKLRQEKKDQFEEKLKLIKSELESLSAFVYEADSVKILEGSEEARFGWASVQYLADKFKDENIIVIDIGGSSTQVTYPDTSKDKMLFTFRGKDFNFKAVSYENLGFNAAVDLWVNDEHKHKIDDCFPKNMPTDIIFNTTTLPKKEVIDIKGTGDFEKCMNSKKELFDGRTLINLSSEIEKSKLYGIGSISGIFKDFGAKDLEELKIKASEHCVKDYASFFPLSESKFRAYMCINAAHIINLLTEGYKIPLTSKNLILTNEKISKAGWSLGAIISYEEKTNSNVLYWCLASIGLLIVVVAVAVGLWKYCNSKS